MVDVEALVQKLVRLSSGEIELGPPASEAVLDRTESIVQGSSPDGY